MTIVQIGKYLVGINLQPEPFLHRDAVYVKKTNSSDPTEVAIRGFTDSGVVTWAAGTLTIDGQNHFFAHERR